MFSLPDFLTTLVLSLAVTSTSITLALAKVTAPLRERLAGSFFGRVFECLYCTSHWVALFYTLLLLPRPIRSACIPVDLFLTVMVLVTLSGIWAGLFFTLSRENPEG